MAGGMLVPCRECGFYPQNGVAPRIDSLFVPGSIMHMRYTAGAFCFSAAFLCKINFYGGSFYNRFSIISGSGKCGGALRLCADLQQDQN